MTLMQEVEFSRLKRKLRSEGRLSEAEIARAYEILGTSQTNVRFREEFDEELEAVRAGNASRVHESRMKRNSGRFEIGELPAVADPARRERCRASLVDFGLTYCGHLLGHPPSEKMRFFLEREQYAITAGALIHVRWPRGTGKTTWMQIGALWAICYGYRKYLITIAATLDAAKRLVGNILRTVEESEALAADFPEVCVPFRRLERKTQVQNFQTYKGEPTNIAYSTRFLRFPTIAGADSSAGRIEAVGGGGVIRGKNDGGVRPDMVFIDDIQKQSTAKSRKLVDGLLEYVAKDVLGVFGTDADKVCLMTSTPIAAQDFSERIADADEFPMWRTYTMKFVLSWPRRMDLVEEFLKRYGADVANMDAGYTSSRSFYRENLGEIERGAECIDPLAHSGTECSAFHHALILLAQMGRDAFHSELQMEPMHAHDLIEIKPREVCRRVTGFPMCTLPDGTADCVAFCDVNADAEAGMRWGVLAVGGGRVTSLVAYGRWPKSGRLYPEHTPDALIDRHITRAVASVAGIVARLPLRTSDGGKVAVRTLVFDGGWRTRAVAEATRRIGRHFGFPVGWSKGFGWRNYRARGLAPERVGEYCHVATSAQGDFLAIHADYWREQAQSSFLAEPLTPGSCAFFGKEPSAHYGFAAEVCAERLTAKFARPDGLTEWNWAKNGANHWGDVLSGCFAVASIVGLYETSETEAAKVVEEEGAVGVPSAAPRRRLVLRHARKGSAR